MGNSLVVRDAEPADAPAVAGIFAGYALETVVTLETVALSEREWLGKLRAARRAGHPFLVGTFDSTVVGYAYVTPWRTKAAYAHTVENSIYLAPESGGRGYGSVLLRELLVRTAASGARQVIAVIVDADSPASQALHRAAGYIEAGRLRRVGYKHGRWLDTVLMQRSLQAPEDSG